MGLWVGGHAGLKGGEQWEGAGLSQRGAAEVQGLGEHQQAAAGGAGGAGLVTRRPMAVMGAENRCRGWARGEATPTCPGWGWLGQRTAEESQPERERPSEDRAILFLSHLGPRQAKWAGAAGGKAARAWNSSALWYGEGGVGGGCLILPPRSEPPWPLASASSAARPPGAPALAPWPPAGPRMPGCL